MLSLYHLYLFFAGNILFILFVPIPFSVKSPLLGVLSKRLDT